MTIASFLGIFALLLILTGFAVLEHAQDLSDPDPWRDLERAATWVATGVVLLMTGFGLMLYTATLL